MEKTKASELYLKLKNTHRVLHIASLEALGESMHNDIQTTKKALEGALVKLAAIIDAG